MSIFRCKNNVIGRQCDRCAPGFHGYPNCRPCNCNEAGTEEQVCDSVSGQCLCKVRPRPGPSPQTWCRSASTGGLTHFYVLLRCCRRTFRDLDAISAKSEPSIWTRPTPKAAPAASVSAPPTAAAALRRDASRFDSCFHRCSSRACLRDL